MFCSGLTSISIIYRLTNITQKTNPSPAQSRHQFLHKDASWQLGMLIAPNYAAHFFLVINLCQPELCEGNVSVAEGDDGDGVLLCVHS